jgi:hypothetical protein
LGFFGFRAVPSYDLPRMFYPLVLQGQFESLHDLCAKLRINESQIEAYISNARIEASQLVVCDRVVLGDPARKVCAVLELRDAGATLWAGLFAEASEERDEIENFIRATQSVFSVPMAVGEFQPRRSGHA